MFIEVEKLDAHGVSGKDKILCQVARSQDEGANVYRPTFQVPAEYSPPWPSVGGEDQAPPSVPAGDAPG